MTDLDDSAWFKERLYRENERGGEARSVVAACAQLLGLDLYGDRMIKEIWAPENMERVVDALRDLIREQDRLQQKHEALRTALKTISFEAGLVEELFVDQDERWTIA